jgi:hypothetical protein
MKPHHHRIIELKKQGLTNAQIAERVFRSPSAVEKALALAYKSNILVRPEPSHDPIREEIIQRVLAGERPVDVARALGVSKNKVVGVMYRHRRAGEPKPKRERPASERAPPPPVKRKDEMIYLWDLQVGQCRYPAQSDEDGVHLFCGEPVRDSACPYCRSHAAICFEKPTKSKRKKRNFTFVPLKLRHATHDSEI